jgi:hypothetical protein
MCESGVLKSFRLKPGSRKGIRVLADSVMGLMSEGAADATPPEPEPLPTPTPKRASAGRRPRGFRGTIVNFLQ